MTLAISCRPGEASTSTRGDRSRHRTRGRSPRQGVVVVIDVLRSFTVSAYALAGGARECLLVSTVEEARRLGRQIPDATICAEENALPITGIAISNSPTQVAAAHMRGRTLIQRSTAGTPVIGAVKSDDAIFAGSLVVASATAQACLLRRSDYGHARRIGRPSRGPRVREIHRSGAAWLQHRPRSASEAAARERALSKGHGRRVAGLSRHRHRAVAGGRPLRLRDARHQA